MKSITSYASDPVVFVSAFKSGEEGAIHAYHFDTHAGQLKLVHRTTDVENPFFMVVSPNDQILYSIDAKKFGLADDDFVATYMFNVRGCLFILLIR